MLFPQNERAVKTVASSRGPAVSGLKGKSLSPSSLQVSGTSTAAGERRRHRAVAAAVASAVGSFGSNHDSKKSNSDEEYESARDDAHDGLWTHKHDSGKENEVALVSNVIPR